MVKPMQKIKDTMVTLTTLRDEINAAHREALKGAQTKLEQARIAGQKLILAKGLWSGNWPSWVDENCEFSNRTARAYMRIASNWKQIWQIWQKAATEMKKPDYRLTIDGALELLKATPSEKKKAKEEAEAEQNKGKPPDQIPGISLDALGLIISYLAIHKIKVRAAQMIPFLIDLGIDVNKLATASAEATSTATAGGKAKKPARQPRITPERTSA